MVPLISIVLEKLRLFLILLDVQLIGFEKERERKRGKEKEREREREKGGREERRVELLFFLESTIFEYVVLLFKKCFFIYFYLFIFLKFCFISEIC